MTLKVIPLGTKVHVEGYGMPLQQIKAAQSKGNKIDVFYSSHSKSYQLGQKKQLK
ncbi:hypothetical protein RCO48_03465 [Peribacillus frigoritolerans]|nr:hypothetical protein [Peribacillus frigoritolerans]